MADDVRLVPMRVAGKYSKGGLKLVPVAGSHREAWEGAITEKEAEALRVFTEQTWNSDPDTEKAVGRAYTKIYVAFARDSE
jgi:hypothetical protein